MNKAGMITKFHQRRRPRAGLIRGRVSPESQRALDDIDGLAFLVGMVELEGSLGEVEQGRRDIRHQRDVKGLRDGGERS